MKVRDFLLEDIKTLEEWLHGRDRVLSVEEDVPSIGVIADDVAACFLRMTDGNRVGWFEGLTTNPSKSSEERSLGIDLVVGALVEKAKNLGVKSVMAYTVEYSVLLRMFSVGFKQCPHILIGLKLDGVDL